MPRSNKAFKTSVSFPGEQGDWIVAESRRQGDRGASAVLQSLVAERMANTLPHLDDEHLLEQLVRLVRPERADRFARLWRQQSEALPNAQRELAYTQAEAAGALFDAFLDAIEVGSIRPLETRAITLLPPGPWDELLDAARSGDIGTIRLLLRQFDGSGIAATYRFPEPPARYVADDPQPRPAKPPKPPSTGTTP